MIKQILITYYGYYLPVVILVGAVLLMLFLFPPASGSLQTDIHYTNKNITQAKTTLDEINQKIKSLENSLKEQQTKLEQLIKKEEQQKLLSNSSWEILPLLDETRNQIKLTQDKIIQIKGTIQEEKQTKQKQESILSKLEDDLLVLRTQQKRQLDAALSGLNLHIGIYLSNTCLTMIQNNINSTCPTYEDLVSLDSSIIEVSGKFVNENGYFHRQEPQLEESWKYYNYDKTFRIIVDPPKGMLDRIQSIEIRPNFDTYLLKGNLVQAPEYETLTKLVNGSVSKKEYEITYQNKTQEFATILYHDRYIDNCRLAYINSDKWLELLPDTVHHLRSDCIPQSTSFNEIEIIPTNYTQHDITTSKKYQHDTWLANVKQHCIYKYKACTE